MNAEPIFSCVEAELSGAAPPGAPGNRIRSGISATEFVAIITKISPFCSESQPPRTVFLASWPTGDSGRVHRIECSRGRVMNAKFFEIVFERLAESQLPSEESNLVLAACQGEAALQDRLSHGTTPNLEGIVGQLEIGAGVYLQSLQVQGFRGIGQNLELKIQPGPGLTLVVGRNGSGKSSRLQPSNSSAPGRAPVGTTEVLSRKAPGATSTKPLPTPGGKRPGLNTKRTEPRRPCTSSTCPFGGNCWSKTTKTWTRKLGRWCPSGGSWPA